MMLKWRGRASPALACALLWCASITCSDLTAPGRSRVAVGIAPVFSDQAAAVYSNLVQVGLVVDNVHLTLNHADGTPATDTTVTITPGQDSVIIEILVDLNGSQETLQAIIDLRDGTIVLFSGTQNIVATAGGIPQAPPPPIPVEYAGPGSTLTSVLLGPSDTTIRPADSVVYRPSAMDGGGGAVADFVLIWSVKDPTIGTISAAGVFKPSVSRGQTYVIARTPNDIKDSALVTITPPATTISIVSGSAQTATVGAALPNPVVVQALASDGLPVPAWPVSLAGSGITFAKPAMLTGANGRDSSTATLATLAGAKTFTASSPGLTSVAGTATAIPGQAAKLAITQQPSATVTSGAVLAVQPTLQVQDQHGNAVAAAGVQVTATLGGVAGQSLSGTATVASDASGLVTFAGLMILGPAGSATLTFSGESLTSATSNTVDVTVAAVDHIAFGAIAGGTGGVVMPSFTVEVLDQFNNRITSGPGSTATVTVAIKPGTGAAGAVLGPTPAALTQAAAAGVATFAVSIDKAALGYQLIATSPSAAAGVESAAFTIAVGPAAQLAIVSGDSLGVLKTNEVVPTVLVRDAGANNVSGASVAFAVASGGGNLSATTGTTNASGVTSVDWHVGSGGAQSMTATIGGLAVTFHAFLAETLVIVTLPDASPRNGLALESQPKIQVRDKTGRQIKLAGISVTAGTCCRSDFIDALAAVLSGTTTAVTDANGEAQFADLTLSGDFGVTTKVTFAAATIDSAYSGLLTMNGGFPQSVIHIDGDYLRSATAGTQLVRARPQDAEGNPVAGQAVTFTVSEGPCTFGGSSSFSTTAASTGIATAPATITGNLTSCTIQSLVVLPPQPPCEGECLALPPPTKYLRLFVAPDTYKVWTGATGATDASYSTAINWFDFSVPGTDKSVFVPKSTGPNNGSTAYPTLFSAQGAKALLIEPGAGLFMNGNNFEAVDTLFADGSVEDGGILVVSGAAAQLRGTVRGIVHIGYSGCVGTTAFVVGAFTADSIEVNCVLKVLENFPVDVAGQMRVKDGASLYQSKGTITVTDSAFFGGREELSGGILDLQGAVKIESNCENMDYNGASPHITRLTRASGDTLKASISDCVVTFGVLEVVATNAGGAALTTTSTFPMTLEIDTLRIVKDARLRLGLLTSTTIGTYLVVEDNAHLHSLATLLVGVCVPSQEFGGDNVGPFTCSGWLPSIRAAPGGKHVKRE